MTYPTPYRPFPNQFKQDLLAGKRLIGCWASLASPITAEVLGVAGFDWILLDGEHSPNDVVTFVPQLMALKDSVSAPFVRPTSNNQRVFTTRPRRPQARVSASRRATVSAAWATGTRT